MSRYVSVGGQYALGVNPHVHVQPRRLSSLAQLRQGPCVGRLGHRYTMLQSSCQNRVRIGSVSGSVVGAGWYASRGRSWVGPSTGALRKVGIVWFRNDLRLHDNEALVRASAECTSIVPVYCFDPREYGCGRGTARKYGKTGPYRAMFVIDAVKDLRERLRERGSDLMVAVGKPEDVIPDVGRRVGAQALYCHTEVTYEETQVEDRVKNSFAEETGGLFHSFWTNTLHHVDDLPSGLDHMPQSFDEFKAGLENVTPRKCLEEQTSLRSLPIAVKNVSLSMGDIPSLEDLGIAPLTTSQEEEEQHSKSSFPCCKGGETEALKQLERFVSSIGSLGKRTDASFSGNIAPWLASGCLSPRRMLESVLHQASQQQENDTPQNKNGSLKWIQFELLWRDFFRMLTRALSRKEQEQQPRVVTHAV